MSVGNVGVLRAEARLFGREPAALFWVGAFPSLLVVALGLVPAFREAGDELGGRRVIDLYVPVTVLLALIMAGMQAMPAVLAAYREQGILRRMRVTPVRPGALLTAQIAVHGAAALVSAVLAIVVGRVGFGVALPGQPFGYAVALAAAALVALATGAAVAAVASTTKVATALSTVVFFPSMFTAGVYVPVQVLPDGMQRILEFTPFSAASQALDEAMRGGWPGWTHLLVMAVWLVALTTVAVRRFRWE